MPVYHSGNLSKTDRPDWNYPLRPQTKDLTKPLAPRNLLITSPYNVSVLDIRWDNPKIIPQNSDLEILGCNVYRSTDNPYGPYIKVNDNPITVLFYRDQTEEELIIHENATPSIKHTLEPRERWLVYSQHKPIIIPDTNGKATTRILDVQVEVDNGDGVFMEVPAFAVDGITGEIELIHYPVYNYELNQIIPPRLPYSPNGRVRISYRYLKHSVLTVLSQRIYYKVTTVAVDPNDSNSTIETPLDEISERSAFDVEMIDYIWREAILRNRWILEQGGERVKIFIRKWMGPKCPSHQTNYGQSYHDCHVCFPAGTPIRTKKGWKSIENIKKDDMVLTSDGSYQKVTRNFKRDYKGKLILIDTPTLTNSIYATPNHPFLVLRGNHKVKNGCCPMTCNNFIKNGDGLRLEHPNVRLLPSGKWWARAQIHESRGKGRKSLGTFKTKEEAVNAVLDYKIKNFKPGHILEWEEVSNLKKGDWLVSCWNKDIIDIEKIKIPDKYTKKKKYGPKIKGKKEFIVDEEFLWVIGLYIAEGSKGTRSINFSLHKNEIEYRNRIEHFFNKYGYSVSTYLLKNSNGMVVHVSGTALSKWFPEWLGDRCYKKQIPNEFMSLPYNKIWALIEGIYAGDNGDKNEIIQTSEYLAIQLVELLHRVGEQPLVHKQKSKKLTPKGNKRRTAYCVNWATENLTPKNRKNRWFFKGNLLVRIKKKSEISFSGKVYNLEVEGNHTYIINNIAVHNCYGTNIVGGYHGPYDTIIAPPEAEKMIELADMGLHMRYDWASWMGPWPFINPRDVIVRQNNERYVIGPVTPQGSRGAIYQQHFTMSYIDQGDIRYSIPITGGEDQVPTAYDPYREEAPTDASPAVNDKPEIPAERIIRGRTVTFENISY